LESRNWKALRAQPYTGLVWARVGWFGLEWVGLGSSGLVWARVGWFGLEWGLGLGSSGLVWARVVGLGSSGWFGLEWVGLGSSEREKC
jgi:hypothetical protein